MRITYRTPRHAAVPRLVLVLAALIAVSVIVGITVQTIFINLMQRLDSLWASDRTVLSPDLMLMLGWALLFLALGPVFWWLLMPPIRRYEITLEPSAVRLEGDGIIVTAPWESVATMRLEYLPLAHRRFSLDQRMAWHLTVTLAGNPTPLAVPLHTFETDVDEMADVIARYAPESVQFEVSAYDPYGSGEREPAEVGTGEAHSSDTS
jgi:hypothetical protein